ncbi:MAG: hypothetical protein IJD96_11345 [Lachnospiraceae bacterium]|nr:hypothetical protein [Lachnospiraceae bacterium]
METNILCQKEEQVVLTGFYEELMALLQDTDAAAEKEKIKNALKNMSETTTYLVLGEEKVGKTSLLHLIFNDIFDVTNEMEGDICEYRWGEQEAVTPIADGFQRKFMPSENMRGISIIDTKGIGTLNTQSLHKLRELAVKSDVIFAVFDVGKINSSKMWDILESCPQKKMVLFMTKCDAISEQELQNSIDKIKSYMQDSNISAPLFPVCLKEDTKIAGTESIDYVRNYLRDNIIGRNPIARRQKENVEEMKAMLVQLQDSFLLRQKQYQADVKIVNKINSALDAYVMSQQKVIDTLLKKLTSEINNDIENYQQEIISKMDPYKIKERFHTQSDFEAYINMVNDNYKNIMNDSVNRKTIEAMKNCLHELEIVFQEAVGYFNNRESILLLNDKFYGYMAESRRQIVAESKETAFEVAKFYNTLYQASETLFLQIWHAREEYERTINKDTTLSKTVGVLVGALAPVIGKSIGVKLAILKGATLFAPIPMIGFAIVGFVVAPKISKILFETEAKAADKMEEAARVAVNEFKLGVNNTRKMMIEQISQQVTELFERELKFVDTCFTEFRMSVNIDELKLPELEDRLSKTVRLLEKVESLEA